MKAVKIFLAVLVLAAVIFWLWTGNNALLPYVMLIAAIAMLLNMYEAFSKSWKSLDGFLSLAGFIIFGSYGVALFIS